MLKSAMKQNCKPLSQPRILNEPHLKPEPGPSPKSQAQTQHLFLKPDLGPKAKFTECVKICANARYRQSKYD